MCVSCNSINLDEEDHLISYNQFQQTCHFYCAGLNKGSKIPILNKR